MGMNDSGDFKQLRLSHGGAGFQCPCCNRWGITERHRAEAKALDARYIRRTLKQMLAQEDLDDRQG